MLKACIFDLDGVVVATAKYHFLAWKRLANEFGFDFNEQLNEKLKGVSRKESLEFILKWGAINISESEKEAAAKRKNDWYIDYVSNMTSDEILPGLVSFLDELKANDIRIALGSASRNCMMCLERIGLQHYFDVIIDGNIVETAKPNPDVFLRASSEMGLKPFQCVVFEDAQVGIEAANAGGFFSIGVGDEAVLESANLVIASFENFNLNKLREALINF